MINLIETRERVQGLYAADQPEINPLAFSMIGFHDAEKYMIAGLHRMVESIPGVAEDEFQETIEKIRENVPHDSRLTGMQFYADYWGMQTQQADAWTEYDGRRDKFLLDIVAECRGCIEQQWDSDHRRHLRQQHRDRVGKLSSLDLTRKASQGTATASIGQGVERWGSLAEASTRPTLDDRPRGDGSGAPERDPWASVSSGQSGDPETFDEQPPAEAAAGQQRTVGSWAALEAYSEARLVQLQQSVGRPGSASSYDSIGDRGLDSDGNLDIGQMGDGWSEEDDERHQSNDGDIFELG